MIRISLAIATFIFYAVRWRPSVLRRVAKRSVNMALFICDLFFFLLITCQLCGMTHPELAAPTYVNYIGLVAAFLGGAFATSARLALRDNYLPASSTAASRSLTTRGPYRVVRHPSYSGSIIAFIGVEILLNSYLILITLPFVFITCRQIAREEGILSELHGGEWQRFAARTPYKLVPFIY
ncbi:MAG TPA: isoprenylcysteine carboxylmethyltransferase family protein [Thermoanaerobaculia bacterium]|nr:isoprenylcysteine carboxylmethyltransferase family protein [Thermoanaerobaculia bacterium]